MKKQLLAILLLVCSFSFGQTGIWGWGGNFTNAELHQGKLNGYTGWRFTVKWYDDQHTKTDLSHSFIKSNIKRLADSGYDFCVQTWKGNNAPISGSYTWLKTEGVPTFTTTGGNINGPWPDYYNSTYIFYSNKYDKSLADSIYSWCNADPVLKAHFKSLFPSYGSTGDEGPIKGTPPPAYDNIKLDATWNAYVAQRLDSAYSWNTKNNTFMRLSVNPSNSAAYLASYMARYPGSWMKHGDASHQYPVDGEVYKFNWPRKYVSGLPIYYFAEVDDEIKNSPYQADKFQLVRSAISLKTSRLDFFDEWLYDSDVPAMVAFFNKYSNQYDTVTANKGFCALSRKANFLDTVRFTVLNFGALWSNVTKYNGAINNINKSTDDTLSKQMRYVGTAKNYANKSRIDAIEATGIQYNPEGPYYNNDLGFYLVDNYSLNVKQLLINETATALDRIDAGALYGRNAIKAKAYGVDCALYFSVSKYLKHSDMGDNVDITVTYKDEGNSTWYMQAYMCKRMYVQNTNSHQWKTATLHVTGFKWGGKLRYGSDIILSQLKNNEFPVDMIEVINKSK